MTTPSGGPFDAELGTPEGDQYPTIRNETELRKVIEAVMQAAPARRRSSNTYSDSRDHLT